MSYSALITDLYQLTMLAGYLEQDMHETHSVFDLFFRHNPYQGGYAVFAGLEPALEYLENLCFSGDELAYLRGLGMFDSRFLDFMADFRFRG
ncbi:MAG: nicotinate phosphoribosyltransferase, partial [Desulfuromonadales bacterium]|nr:nicotinate phosphoribosyltransferase [Desulfuromonadales bacterium]